MAVVGSGAGGSGAGGSGAGGSGAGGSGAGGSGAGGSGAGGSGAGGHAGGPSSSTLNLALTITSDAITGYWDGSFDVVPTSKPNGYDSLSYLNPSRRMSLLASECLGCFQVEGVQRNPTTVKLLDQEIHKTKPPGTRFFKEQLKWLRNYSDLRSDRIPEINTQISDLLSFFGMVGQLDAGGHKYSLEALGVVQDVTYSVAMRVKHLAWAPRPIAYSTKVAPIIQTPDHSTFPSGHASEAFALAVVLDYMLGLNDKRTSIDKSSMVYRLAHRISANRTIAGVHFPVDSAAGASLGIAMGHAMLAILFGVDPVSTEFKTGDADGEFSKTQDFLLSEVMDVLDDLTKIEKTKPQSIAGIYACEIKKEWGVE